MKTSILAACGFLVIAALAWCLRSAFVGPQTKPISHTSSPQMLAAPSKVSGRDTPAQAFQPPQRKSEPVLAAQTTSQVPRQAQVQAPSAPSQQVPSAASSQASASAPQASAPVKSAAIRPPFSHPIAATVSPAASSIVGAPANNPEPPALELDPGVPVPAALLPAAANLPPAAAAAQQQLADSFVQDVNALVAQPGTNDAAASDAYFNSLSKSNEQYRALYGDDAYNRAVIQTALDAKGGN